MKHYLEIVETDLKYPIVFFDHSFDEHKQMQAHWHAEIEIVYVVSGSMETYIDGTKKIVFAGELVIINSTSLHYFVYLEPTHIYTFQLSTQIFYEFNLPTDVQFEMKKQLYENDWLDDFIHYPEIIKTNDLCKHIQMYQLYNKLIQDCQCAKTSSKLQSKGVIQEILLEIDQHYAQDLTLESLAEKFHFHPNSLSRLFKQKTHLTFHQYLQKVRLNHAYYDLMHTDLTILEIALNHGFKNLKSFEKLFKEIYHEQPFVYRKRLRNA